MTRRALHLAAGAVRRIHIRGTSRRTRAILAAATAVPLLAALVLVGLRHTLPPTKPRVLSGTVWLASRAIGKLTLVDGAAAQVAADVTVAAPGTEFTALQQGRFGYAIDNKSGRAAVVDSATLDTVAGTPLPGSPGGIVAYATETSFYVFNTHSRLLQAAEPRTLGQLGRPAAVAGTDRTTASAGNGVWALEPATGQIAHLGATTSSLRENLRRPVIRSTQDVSLHVTAGLPVVLDRATGLASVLDPETGRTRRTLLTNVKDDHIVTGSPTRQRLFIAEPATAALTVCTFQNGACDFTVSVGVGGDELGPTVEVGDHAYVPNHSSNTVSIVDLSSRAVARTVPLFNRNVPFELIPRDGLVFYNDPNSEHAGVIAPDGQVRRIKKYEPPKPTPTVQRTKDNPKSEPTSDPERTPTPSPVGTQRLTPSPSGSPSPGGDLRIQRLRITPRTPEAGQEVHFAADVTGTPDTWQWSVVRDPDGTAEVSSANGEFDHVFDAPGTYRVTLVVVAGPGRAEQSTALTVAVPSPQVRCGDRISVSVVLRADLDCGETSPAIRVIGGDVVIDLNGHTLRSTRVAIEARPLSLENPTENVVVRNGTVFGGVGFERVPGARVEDVTLNGHLNIAQSPGAELRGSEVWAQPPFAVEFSGSSNPVVADVDVRGGMHFSSAIFPVVNDSTITGGRFRVEEFAGTQVTRSTFVDVAVSVFLHDDAVFADNEFVRSKITHFGNSLDNVYQRNRFEGATVAIDLQLAASEAGTLIEDNQFERNDIGVSITGPLNEAAGLTLRRNTFSGNRKAGIFIQAPSGERDGPVTIANNTFTANGRGAPGPVNDGLHVDIEAGEPIFVIRDNTSRSNGDCGIEIRNGAVIDGRGNTSQGDPRGCVGVDCG
ncbi:right-handed parallel beta-helix repeat-containing protein [Phytohabitans aurantiacus]|uniref:PKD domain-containing protein n=1 Tax=Phytohabitans aurantiacus TaxID=3016789 RepID=A0ABQ5R3Q3_9ACTN|nr:right-handed parallel beta-helix repeat-containing protein [Phytohabitans aurantiacus]GLI01045.1 hypothetical protein Pa4123_63210 [Phytohabitans aurantiacus]